MQKQVAIIGGVGIQSDFSTSLINKLLEKNYHVVGIARSGKYKERLLDSFSNNENVEFAWGDLQDANFVNNLALTLEKNTGPVTTYIHNAAKLVLQPFLETAAEDFEQSWQITVKTAVIASQILLPAMLKRQQGTLIFTGATASLKGNAKSSPFAVAKFGLRALSQSLAREFSSQGIHVAHVIADGVIIGKRAQGTFNLSEDKCIKPDALANLYLDLIKQDSSCWTHEVDLRPSTENF